jgi:hypothetical protein
MRSQIDEDRFPDAALSNIAQAVRGQTDYLPVPGTDRVFIHMDFIPETTDVASLGYIGQVHIATSALRDRVQEARDRAESRRQNVELQRQAVVEEQPGWEFAAVGRAVWQALCLKTPYKAQPTPRNTRTKEVGF